jgi:hypothetical protein
MVPSMAMKRLRMIAGALLFGLVVSGCSVGIEPPPPTPVAQQPATTEPTLSARGDGATPLPTAAPIATAEPTATPQPTLTMAPTPTVEPTLTAQPTATTPPVAADAPLLVLERPVAGMFLDVPVEISGTVDVAVGQIRATIYTPDGEPLGLEPVLLPTTPISTGLQFRGTVPLGNAPTPRGVVVVVEYLDEAGDVAATAEQPTNVEGRFARLQYMAVEGPLPYTRPTDPTILVYGAAAGPPARVEVLLLDSGGNVLVSVPAALGWYQPGLPCDFAATIENRAEGVTVEVRSFDADGTQLEQVRVPLAR